MVDVVTYEQILDRMLLSVPDTMDKREGSIIYDALAPAAAELTLCYHQLQMLENELFADTASLEYLIRRCTERGIAQKKASPAEVKGDFTPDSIDVLNKRFAVGDISYTVTEKIAAGKYKLTCNKEGTVGNLSSGVLVPLDGVSGLKTASITALLIPGEDDEDVESLRQRYFDSFKFVYCAGNIADYKNKTLALSGVGGVKVIPTWAGGGTVKLIIVDSTFKKPSAALVSEVKNTMDPEPSGTGAGLAPVGHKVTVVGAENVTVSISTEITYATGYDYSTASTSIEEIINAYFEELIKVWQDNEKTIVRISQIETRLLDLVQILDIQNTKLNGAAENLQLNSSEIPVLGDFDDGN